MTYEETAFSAAWPWQVFWLETQNSNFYDVENFIMAYAYFDFHGQPHFRHRNTKTQLLRTITNRCEQSFIHLKMISLMISCILLLNINRINVNYRLCMFLIVGHFSILCTISSRLTDLLLIIFSSAFLIELKNYIINYCSIFFNYSQWTGSPLKFSSENHDINN